MIQRKQTLYLLFATILIILNFFNPFVSTNDLSFSVFQIKQLDIANPIIIKSYPIAIYLIFLSLLHLFTILLFKNRIIQMRFTVFCILLSIGFYALLFFYHFLANRQLSIALNQYHYSLVSLLLAAIFDYMAFGGIRKDEKIVRDSDRLR